MKARCVGFFPGIASGLLCVFFLLGCAHSTPPQRAIAPIERADISYNFQSMPLDQMLEVYGSLAGKTVIVGNEVDHHIAVRAVTERSLTRIEALRFLEKAMEEQASVTIVHRPNGSLLAVPLVDDTVGRYVDDRTHTITPQTNP